MAFDFLESFDWHSVLLVPLFSESLAGSKSGMIILFITLALQCRLGQLIRGGHLITLGVPLLLNAGKAVLLLDTSSRVYRLAASCCGSFAELAVCPVVDNLENI